MSIMFDLVYSSWMANIITYISIYDFVWPLAYALTWKLNYQIVV
jgi:hypothetical protein